jgi:hypothetical protein
LAKVIPFWLHTLSIAALLTGAVCAIVIAVDVARHPQHMAIMNVVWPVTALFAGPAAAWIYASYGRLATHEKAMPAMKRGEDPPSKKLTPFPVMVATGAAHCGAGCCLGDILAEWLCFGVPAIAIWFGWQSIFTEKMFAVWVVDFLCAFGLGIVFQYFAIAPMRDLSFGQGIIAALKADTLSLTAWQIGMYGVMALAQYAYFRPLLGKMLEVNTPEFWLTMQIAMLAGFITSYPVNWWLIRAGIKEKM